MKAVFIPMLMLFVSSPATSGSPIREEVRFISQGVALSGTLVIPEGRVHAALVFVHGSGKQERNLALAERFAAEGIAALVYDKRGTGKSGGAYEGNQSVSGKNVALLADDALAALAYLSSHSRLHMVPTGLAGISQAGWIAPLAARKDKRVQFLVLWSGPVCKVSEEDIYSKFTRDVDGATAPSYLEALNARKEKYLWPGFLGRDTDSAEDLAALSIPGLWIFSDNDRSIPVDLSIRRLQALRRQGHQYDYALLSGLGHNNMDQTFPLATDWIHRLAR